MKQIHSTLKEEQRPKAMDLIELRPSLTQSPTADNYSPRICSGSKLLRPPTLRTRGVNHSRGRKDPLHLRSSRSPRRPSSYSGDKPNKVHHKKWLLAAKTRIPLCVNHCVRRIKRMVTPVWEETLLSSTAPLVQTLWPHLRSTWARPSSVSTPNWASWVRAPTEKCTSACIPLPV